MKHFLLFFAAFLFFSCQGPDRKDASILWLGSSSTYCHDLPLQSSEWLNSYAGWNTTVSLAGRSGTSFHEYMRPGFEPQYGFKEGETLLEKVASESHDYVVIQQISYFMADVDSTEIIESTRRLCEAVRAAGGTPVFYEMGWRLEPLNELGREMILREARNNGIKIYIPCSTAWDKVRAERPGLELHNLPDTDHPGTAGTYLNLCCAYAAFTGETPVGLPADVFAWPRFGAFDKAEAGRRVDATTLDYYHAVMPEWMQNISIMGKEYTLDKETAAYLQEMAWKTWKDISKHLNR